MTQFAPTPLATYLPQRRYGSILITSRRKDAAARLAGGHTYVKEVSTADESQAFSLFRNQLECVSNEEGASDLLRALDYVPLAITQAAAFINRRGRMTASGYLDDFRRNAKQKESLLNWDSGELCGDSRASNPIVGTWQMSFETIREQRCSAADLLSLMSFFNPEEIPEWILRRHSKSVAKTGDEDEIDSTFDEDLETLRAYSLITATANSGVWKMHTTVRFCTRVWLSTFSNSGQWERDFLGLMTRAFPLADFKNWATWQQLLPLVDSLYESELSDHESVKKWALVLNQAAWYMQTALGKYDEAERLNWRALEGCEKKLGEQHPNTLMSVSNLALVLWAQGKYDKAEMLNRRALEEREKELGEQHPDTLTIVNNLASVLQDQGKYEEAERLDRRALEGREEKLGEQHPDTLMSVNNLASVLWAQGKYEEAEKLNRQALEGREKKLGEQHPDTLMSVNNLASVLQDQGKYDEAERLDRRALGEREKKLGEQHPDTLMSMSNLALVLEHQRAYDKAERLNRRALEGREKKLGEQHPDTLVSVYNLAYLLHKRKRYGEASGLYRRACDGYERKLGSQHPAATACLNNFQAMRQEAKQERLRQSRTSISNNEAALRKTSTQGFASVNSGGTVPEPANSKQESKQGSLYTRFKRRLSKSDL